LPENTQSLGCLAAQTADCVLSTIAVCVATYRRPEGIRRLLRALEELEFQTSPTPSIYVVVVDNDPNSDQAVSLREEFSGFRWKLKLLAETQRGISFARNRAVREALSLGADAIAFIDDDEVPDPGWLDALLQVQMSSGAAAVSGPVLPHFEGSVPEWVIKGGFFDRPRFATGTSIEIARTGNLLLLTKVLKNCWLLFHQDFGLSGGEDTLLTSQLRKQGARIVWADESIVREWIGRDRVNTRYILRRAFVGGANWVRIERFVDPRLLTVFKRVTIATGRIAKAMLLLVPSLLRGRHAIVTNAKQAYLGMGMLAGLFRFRSQLYK